MSGIAVWGRGAQGPVCWITLRCGEFGLKRGNVIESDRLEQHIAKIGCCSFASRTVVTDDRARS
jgi:hypothetical protein